MLGWNHVFLARSEEKEVLAKFGEVYPVYTAETQDLHHALMI